MIVDLLNALKPTHRRPFLVYFYFQPTHEFMMRCRSEVEVSVDVYKKHKTKKKLSTFVEGDKFSLWFTILRRCHLAFQHFCLIIDLACDTTGKTKIKEKHHQLLLCFSQPPYIANRLGRIDDKDVIKFYETLKKYKRQGKSVEKKKYKNKKEEGTCNQYCKSYGKQK